MRMSDCSSEVGCSDLWVAIRQPHRVGVGPDITAQQRELVDASEAKSADTSTLAILWSTIGISALVVLVLGGIWLGVFTPTEGAGVGATLALVLALVRGMRRKEMIEAIISVDRKSVV